ncbi:uncharacterized protein ACOB7L_006034 isoform 1-T1 [Callospermophilus lateralis]|uniref:uncharacterized protein LOC143388433 n=1 Tax=Callospermophilus lateralis TaxID=76772 RepID=UPI00405444A5
MQNLKTNHMENAENPKSQEMDTATRHHLGNRQKTSSATWFVGSLILDFSTSRTSPSDAIPARKLSITKKKRRNTKDQAQCHPPVIPVTSEAEFKCSRQKEKMAMNCLHWKLQHHGNFSQVAL